MERAVFAEKTCIICATTWTPTTRYQAARNQTCGRACTKALIGRAATGRPSPHNQRATVACAVCGKEKTIPQAWLRKVKRPTCSRQCNGVLRGQELTSHAHKGRSGWTAVSMDSYLKKMTGADNPSWKGGVTYRRDKGNYKGARSVRCPPDLPSMAMANGYVMEHRLVMARWVGRPLTRQECVHHLDHDPLNNDRSNLELWPCNRTHKLAEHGRPVDGAANRLCRTDSAPL
jgi:hypothetical protein